jgi:hypothetical protein
LSQKLGLSGDDMNVAGRPDWNDKRFSKMAPKDPLERLTVNIASLGKDEVKAKIRAFNNGFRLDFSDAYLDGLSLDRLRHILLAAMMTTLRKNAG